MDTHTRKTLDAITHGRAPRDLDWKQFVSMWDDVADDVTQESGDRLVVRVNGHRAVFRRSHNGRVSLDDIDQARRVLAAQPDTARSGHLIAVAIDAKHARILDFDQSSAGTDDTERQVRDRSPVARRLRTVERNSGSDDVAQLDAYFDEVAAVLLGEARQQPFVVLGHGHGKSDVAAAFVERLRHSHAALAGHLRGTADVDLSAATDADLEAAARAAHE